jgi:Beta-lactamase
MTVRELLAHTSSLYSYTNDANAMAPYLSGELQFASTPRELVGFAAAHPLLFAPGAQFSYSNTDYIVLGLLGERIAAESYESSCANRRAAEAPHTILPTGQEALRCRPSSFRTSIHLVGLAAIELSRAAPAEGDRLRSRGSELRRRRGAHACRRGSASCWKKSTSSSEAVSAASRADGNCGLPEPAYGLLPMRLAGPVSHKGPDAPYPNEKRGPK